MRDLCSVLSSCLPAKSKDRPLFWQSNYRSHGTAAESVPLKVYYRCTNTKPPPQSTFFLANITTIMDQLMKEVGDLIAPKEEEENGVHPYGASIPVNELVLITVFVLP